MNKKYFNIFAYVIIGIVIWFIGGIITVETLKEIPHVTQADFFILFFVLYFLYIGYMLIEVGFNIKRELENKN